MSTFMIIYLIISGIITGCAAQENNQSAAVNQTKSVPRENKKAETKINSVQNAYIVIDETSLPTCDKASEGVLVYVKSISQFKTCQASVWETIDLDGARGIQGVAGTNGTNGVNGIDGTNGVDGLNSPKGIGDTWVDPDTSLSWVIANDSQNYDDAVSTCAAMGASLAPQIPYRFNYFLINYLITIPIDAKYWTSMTSPNGHYSRVIGFGEATGVDSYHTETHLVVCVK